MTDTRERNLYIVQDGDAIYVHTVSKDALHRVENSRGVLIVAKDGTDIHGHLNGNSHEQP